METNSFGGESKLSAWLYVSAVIDWRSLHCQGQVDHKVYECRRAGCKDRRLKASVFLLIYWLKFQHNPKMFKINIIPEKGCKAYLKPSAAQLCSQ